MDLAALVRAGRQSEIIAKLEPASSAGSHVASNNLSVVYRWIGDNKLEHFYALRAYQQDPLSVVGLGALFRTLTAASQPRLLTDIYANAPNKRRLGRDHHLHAALAYCKINRTREAQEALGCVADYPRSDVADLEIAAAMASAEPDHQKVLALLDSLEALKIDVESRRIWELFASNDPKDALHRFEMHRNSNVAVSELKSLATFCAILIDDYERVLMYSNEVSGDALSFANLYLSNETHVQIQGASRSYRVPFLPKNLSVSLAHSEGQFYEIKMLNRLKSTLMAGDVVIDVGANIGNHSIFFAGECGCQVIAFECNPRITPYLISSVEENSLSEKIDLQYIGNAVSNAPGLVNFNFMRDDFSNISTYFNSNLETVPSVSLDSLELSACRLLKIDVDGGEFLVLQGAEGTIRRLRPLISIEVSNFNTSKVLEFMKSVGYEILSEDTTQSTYSDFIFSHFESRENIP